MKIAKLNILHNTLVIIPARGGSKRIKDKNIRPINGKPMIHWPLSRLCNFIPSKNILVSTDSQKIRDCIKPFQILDGYSRPEILAGDYTGTSEVVLHALNWFELNVKKVEYVLVVYPTSVFIRYEDVLSAMSILVSDRTCSYVLTISDFDFPILRALTKSDDGSVRAMHPDLYAKRSQDLPNFYHDAAQFYLYRAETINNKQNLLNSRARYVQLDRNKCVDIDTYEDLKIAEVILRQLEQ